ncbi:MAG: hypothetical protein GXP26_04900 [Planctomycetes bacterium]|nr:hypothetical protein [Planctomycetota bacterium]
MVQLLLNFDPSLKLMLIGPIAIALAAWALRLACSFSSITPPPFLQAVLSMVAIIAAQLVVRVYLELNQVPPGLGRVVIAPLITSAAMIGICVPTGPMAAISVAIFHAGICFLLFMGLAAVGDTLITPLFG